MNDNDIPSLAGCQAVLANLMVGEHSARSNSAPVHVIFSHYLAGFLTPTMQVVLNWLITHDATGLDGEGRPSNQRRFSAAQIAAGYAVDGRRISWGCGCNRGTVIKTLNALEDLRIIRRIGDPKHAKKGRDGEFGCLWELHLNFAEWDWETIHQQKTQSELTNQARSQKARRILEDKRAPSTAPAQAQTAPGGHALHSTDQTTPPGDAPQPPSGGAPENAPAAALGAPPNSAAGRGQPEDVHPNAQPGMRLSGNRIADESVAQSAADGRMGVSHNPVSNASVAQTHPRSHARLSYIPIQGNNIVVQTDLAPLLINESPNNSNERDVIRVDVQEPHPPEAAEHLMTTWDHNPPGGSALDAPTGMVNAPVQTLLRTPAPHPSLAFYASLPEATQPQAHAQIPLNPSHTGGALAAPAGGLAGEPAGADTRAAMQVRVDYFRWAFSRSAEWQNEPCPLTNSQVREMSEWTAQFGEDALTRAIDTVSRYPKPPTLERAFGLVRHILKKHAAERLAPAPPEVDAAPEQSAAPAVPHAPPPDENLQAQAPAPEVDAQNSAWQASIQALTAREISAVSQLRGYLHGEMSRADYQTWFAPAALLGRSPQGALIFGLANAYACEWVENRLAAVIRRYLTGVLGEETGAEFCVAPAEALALGK